MIVVIADDISGAAELAGVAFERGLSAEVQTRFDSSSKADVVALDTDSRLLESAVASRRVGEITRHVASAKPSLVYKKVDSALRGSIVAEVDAILDATGQRKALLIPANPSRGRLIKLGEYFVEGVSLADTAFARDPTHPAWTSNVLELLGPSAAGGTTSVRAVGAVFDRGITVPDVASVEDLKRRALEVDESILPAGGAEFFGAILDVLMERSELSAKPGKAEASPGAEPGGTRLIVCGSAAAWANGRRELAAARNAPCFEMPPRLASLKSDDRGGEAATAWAFEIWSALRERGLAMMSIGGAEAVDSGDSERLLKRLVDAVEIVFRKAEVGRLALEGGATARAVIDRLGWTSFETAGAVAGLSWLRVAGAETPRLLIKPGSYDWPDEAFGGSRGTVESDIEFRVERG